MENNNNFIEEETKSLKDNFVSFVKSLYKFLHTTLSFANDVDAETTIVQIKKDIDFKGLTVWILFFSILIASIGLNVDSIPVIIGAMLISPLMGPIMGIGLAVGTNDGFTLIRSLKSFGTAVGVSLLASTFYFLVTPFDEAGHQLLSRTQPLLFDAFIAIFGGLAGIMAASTSKNKVSNVIPGVAIATALMPPLCTAGYGLSQWNMQFFFGAFYLFLINSVYISLATFVVVRYLKFPIVHFIDPIREQKIKRIITLFAIVLVIPSVITLYTSYQENNFSKNVKHFVGKYFDKEYTSVVTDFRRDSISVIYINTSRNSNNLTEGFLNKQLLDFNLKKTTVVLEDENERFTRLEQELNKIKLGDMPLGNSDIVREYKNTMEMLRSKDMEIMALLNQIDLMQSDTTQYKSIYKETRVNYPGIKSFSYGKITQYHQNKIYEIPTVLVKWNGRYQQQTEQQKLANWLKLRLQLDTLQVINY